MLAALLCMFSASLAADVPAVPDALHEMPAYASRYGPALVKEFVKSRLAERNPAMRINDETLDATAMPLISVMENMEADKQQLYLRGVHDRVASKE